MELNTGKVISFVLSREAAEGGFSFAQTTPRTLDDTYYALRTLELLGYDYQSQKTLEYIKGIWIDRFTPAKIVYQATYLFRLLHTDCHSRLADLIALKLSSSDYSLKDLYFLLSSLRYLHSAPKINPMLRSQITRLSILDLRTMDNVLRQLLLMHQLHIPFDRTTYVEWIKRSQNGDGGFGFYPGTTSFLENTYYALKALSVLGSEPVDLQGCREFVQSCQASNGGFGRQSITVPQLNSTYHAMFSLLRLEKMERQGALDQELKGGYN